MNPTDSIPANNRPLCVDLDGTLIRSDMLLENLLFILREKPWQLIGILPLLLKGRAPFKKAIAEKSQVNYATLPWRMELIDWLKRQKNEGRKIYLVTASDKKNADSAAEYLGIFDEVIASDGNENLKAARKAARLTELFGKEGFDYIGDAHADIPVWKAAGKGICVTSKERLLLHHGLQDKVRIDFVSPSSLNDTPGSPPRVNVLGVGISVLNLATAVDCIKEAVAQKKKGYIAVTGVHGVSEAQTDPAFRQILNRSFLNTPDGMPMVWLGKFHRHRGMSRVYGPDLMLAVNETTRNTSTRHFYYGGKEGVAELLKTRMEKQFPGLQVVGTYSPPFRPLNAEEERDLQTRVTAAKPDIIWIGLSTPKQEKFMAAYLDKLDATLLIGVGAAFDIHAGMLPQAPRWMQRAGLEWLFRLLAEPKRLWKRYLVNNPLFILRIAMQLTGIKRYPLQD